MSRAKSIVLYMPYLPVGGAERVTLMLAEGFQARGHPTTILLDRWEGELAAAPSGVRLAGLDAPRSLAALPRLAGWLRRERPDVLLSPLSHQNIIALWANRLAGRPTRIVVSEHSILSRQARDGGFSHRAMPFLARRFYRWADARVVISAGAREDLAAICRLPASAFEVIHNPVIPDGFATMSPSGPPHPWLAQGDVPTIVAAGRLVPLKGFDMLLRAMAMIEAPAARLLLLGDGPLRAELAATAERLGIGQRVGLVGAVRDPVPYFAHADAVAMTSRYEGFGNVLVEAMACGTPVVSTDCPAGPAEILQGGRLGPLTPVDDPAAFAAALASVLSSTPDREALKRRAGDFTVSRSVDAYLALFDRIT